MHSAIDAMNTATTSATAEANGTKLKLNNTLNCLVKPLRINRDGFWTTRKALGGYYYYKTKVTVTYDARY